MSIKFLSVFLILVASSHAGVIFGKNGALRKLGNAIGINNLVSVDADAQVNLLGNKVGADAAVGIGEHGIGAHAAVDADVLGQKAKVGANVLDGAKIDQHNHEVFTDPNGGQYVLQRQYIGSKSVLVRKYLNGGIYAAGANEDNVLQHRQIDESRSFDPYQRGEIVQEEVVPGWQKDGTYISRDELNQRRVFPRGQRNGQYIAEERIEVVPGWQKDGTYISVDELRRKNTRERIEVVPGWQKDGTYIAVDEPHDENVPDTIHNKVAVLKDRTFNTNGKRRI